MQQGWPTEVSNSGAQPDDSKSSTCCPSVAEARSEACARGPAIDVVLDRSFQRPLGHWLGRREQRFACARRRGIPPQARKYANSGMVQFSDRLGNTCDCRERTPCRSVRLERHGVRSLQAARLLPWFEPCADSPTDNKCRLTRSRQIRCEVPRFFLTSPAQLAANRRAIGSSIRLQWHLWARQGKPKSKRGRHWY